MDQFERNAYSAGAFAANANLAPGGKAGCVTLDDVDEAMARYLRHCVGGKRHRLQAAFHLGFAHRMDDWAADQARSE